MELPFSKPVKGTSCGKWRLPVNRAIPQLASRQMPQRAGTAAWERFAQAGEAAGPSSVAEP